MKKVNSIGGIFFKCRDPKAMYIWYAEHLGIQSEEYGANFEWRKADEPDKKGYTAFSFFKSDTKYFEPSQQSFMLNFRVSDLEGLLSELKASGIQQIGELQVYEYGKFAHIIDPEGNKIELWEPNDSEYQTMIKITVK